MDANFGLVLKKSSSKSKKMPIRSEQLFVADTEVVNFMEKYDDSSGETKKVSNIFKIFVQKHLTLINKNVIYVCDIMCIYICIYM